MDKVVSFSDALEHMKSGGWASVMVFGGASEPITIRNENILLESKQGDVSMPYLLVSYMYRDWVIYETKPIKQEVIH